ncbi:MAG: glycosyl transferase [Verrucomicrobiaceae bacterium]|nr:glycosyl transferase [Verrucomicrobiaceae bacterium]
MALWILLFASAFFLHGVLAWSTGIAYVGYDTALLCFVGWQTLPLLKPFPIIAVKETRPTLGVIVAAHNETAVLPITLAALLNQNDSPDQIVIADDGSSDNTANLLTSQFGLIRPDENELSAPSSLHPNLRWLRLAHGGKARALNAAITRLETTIVLTADADTLLDNNACGAMRDAFAAEPNLIAASGILTPVCGNTFSGRFFQWFQTYEYIRNFIARFAWTRVDSLLLISGAFAGFKREALLTVGGFDPNCLVEDYELIHRLQRYGKDHDLGWQVRVVGNAHARTDAPATLPTFLRQRRRWFAGFLQTQYWNRDMTGNRRYGRLGTWMLPVKAVDTLQPIYGLTAFLLLIAFLINSHQSIVASIFTVIGIKIVIDLFFHLWSIYLYRRWTGDRHSSNIFYAIVAALAEPFSFQLLRHTGATLGWIYFLTGRQHWGAQSRSGLTTAATTTAG